MLPASVIDIKHFAFSECKNLASVTIQHGVKHIGVRAFADCPNLTCVKIPASVSDIGGIAFDGCNDLTIYCPKGSYAEQYAEEHNITCIVE